MHPLGEQLNAGRGEFHMGATLVHPEPAALDRQLHAGAVIGRVRDAISRRAERA